MLSDSITAGLCQCGCGKPTPIAKVTNRTRGWIKGEPIRFCHGHSAHINQHQITQVNPETREATCRRCGPTWVYRDGEKWRCSKKRGTKGRKTHFILDDGGGSGNGICKKCGAVELKLRDGYWRCANALAENKRNYRNRTKYDLTPEAFAQKLADQCGRCACCQDPLPTKKWQIAIDHDHATGRTRDLLCRWCNLTLGHAKDDPARLRATLAYLERHTGK